MTRKRPARVSRPAADTVAVGYLDPGSWSASFGQSLRDLYLYDISHRRHVTRGRELRKVCGAGAIAGGRNDVMRAFLDTTTCDWLWFVDTDMSYAADTVERMVAAADPVDRPVLGGLCFAQLAQGFADLYAERHILIPTIYDYVETPDEVGFRPVERYPLDQVSAVAGTGAACLLIHRTAAEKVRAEAGDMWFSQITHPAGDHGRPRVFSEDLSFCVRLAAVGIPVHVDTSVKTSHHKGGIFLDEEMFARQQAFAVFEATVGEPAVVTRPVDEMSGV